MHGDIQRLFYVYLSCLLRTNLKAIQIHVNACRFYFVMFVLLCFKRQGNLKIVLNVNVVSMLEII